MFGRLFVGEAETHGIARCGGRVVVKDGVRNMAAETGFELSGPFFELFLGAVDEFCHDIWSSD